MDPHADPATTDPTVAYEVDLIVDAEIADVYLAWLREHIHAMLALPGFLGAELFAVLEPVPPGQQRWCVVYRLRDRTALDRYLTEFAPRMRAEGEQKFGSRFRAQRRVLRRLEIGPAAV